MGGGRRSNQRWLRVACARQDVADTRRGEAYFADLDEAAIIQRWRNEGMSAERAASMVARVDSAMGDCILRLYRSAIDVGREWQPGLAQVNVPGLGFSSVFGDQAVPAAHRRATVGGHKSATTGATRLRPLVSRPPPGRGCCGARGALGRIALERRCLAPAQERREKRQARAPHAAEANPSR